MDWYPIFWNLKGQSVLVFGGGAVATRKVKTLLRAGAIVNVSALHLNSELSAELKAKRITHIKSNDADEFLRCSRLVIVATDDVLANRRIVRMARRAGTPVNVVDDPQHCDFILPAIVDRSPLMIAVSSGGNAPLLTRHVKTWLEARIPRSLSEAADLMGHLRGRIKKRFNTLAQRRAFWEEVIGGSELTQIDAHRVQAAWQHLEQKPTLTSAPVALVGAGPGDPGLLTLRALQLIQACDVVLYDALVSEQILDLIRPEAERIFVGKRANGVHTPQTEIQRQLIQYARSGLRVVRLKGGDPMIFGRGGEEAEALAQAGIQYEIVPGISAANGCAAYAGIPLTHRKLAHTLVMTTGCTRPDGSEQDWAQLANTDNTLVFYMPIQELDNICAQLITNNLPSDWPAALISEGTQPTQRVLCGTLQSLPKLVRDHGVASPAMLMVGKVITMAKALSWYGEPPIVMDRAHEKREAVYSLL